MTAILLFSCKDQRGLVYEISSFIAVNNGNIIDLDEHVDSEEGMFFIRVAWEMESESEINIRQKFEPLAKKFNAKWRIEFSSNIQKLAIFVSKYDHALQEILWRNKIGEFNCQIAVIISNHKELEELANSYKIPFYYFPITKENKEKQEVEEIKLLKELEIDVVILARYMQILSYKFVSTFKNKIINIHHSFLPAFIGGNPYKQAFERGVKMIGATSHFVSDDLDEGPIIAQDIIRINHKDNVQILIRKGRDLERLVLVNAIRLFLEHRVLVHKGKTIVFE